MLSRVADSLYWMSRYLERAEHTVRLLDVNMGLMLDRSGTSAEGRWQRVLAALGNPAGLTWKGDHIQLIRSLTFDGNNRGSITSSIVAARENARQVRDELSTEQWQRLNRLYYQVTESRPIDSGTQLEEVLPAILDGLHLFQGITDTTMNHGEGWQFIQMGRSIERAFATVMLLDIYYRDFFLAQPSASDTSQYLEWIGLLRSCTAFEAYCHVYTADMSHEWILEFLLLNPDFPHSVRYSIDSLRQALLSVCQSSGRLSTDELSRMAGRLQASLHFAEISEVLQQDTAAYLSGILRQCHQIHDLIYGSYIHYSVQAALSA
ncbi:MAG TPA: alpha-E domain-containing protein [Granulicella sp.]